MGPAPLDGRERASSDYRVPLCRHASESPKRGFTVIIESVPADDATRTCDWAATARLEFLDTADGR